ncbi:hypothetical protein ACN6AT_08935 [Streptomyces sp. JL4002]|uniref:hypothetical protein n=1 Tax=Streptomyces sp. JL4002 TaxID=3404781 RepID=UPI003B27B5E6
MIFRTEVSATAGSGCSAWICSEGIRWRGVTLVPLLRGVIRYVPATPAALSSSAPAGESSCCTTP